MSTRTLVNPLHIFGRRTGHDINGSLLRRPFEAFLAETTRLELRDKLVDLQDMSAAPAGWSGVYEDLYGNLVRHGRIVHDHPAPAAPANRLSYLRHVAPAAALAALAVYGRDLVPTDRYRQMVRPWLDAGMPSPHGWAEATATSFTAVIQQRDGGGWVDVERLRLRRLFPSRSAADIAADVATFRLPEVLAGAGRVLVWAGRHVDRRHDADGVAPGTGRTA